MTAAERIVAAEVRRAHAEGIAYFAKHFGHVVAAWIIGLTHGLFVAWVLWLFWFAAVETWTILVSPIVIAVTEAAALAGILWIRRLLRPRSAE